MLEKIGVSILGAAIITALVIKVFRVRNEYILAATFIGSFIVIISS